MNLPVAIDSVPGLLFSLSVATVFCVLARFFWARYCARREMFYQAALLQIMALDAPAQPGTLLGISPRPGDWGIVELAILKWSKDLRGFGHRRFCDIFANSGFADYERGRLKSLRRGIRAQAAQRLGAMLCVSAAPDLIKALADKSPEVRRMASWALANLGQSNMAEQVLTADLPRLHRDLALTGKATVSGTFFWENGDPLEIAPAMSKTYLDRRSLGMYATVKNMPAISLTGVHQEKNVWCTYDTGYKLLELDSERRVSILAVLKQPVKDYYVSSYRRRTNIPVADGSVTRNVDFVFPRYHELDDRISVIGKLVFPELPPGYPVWTKSRPRVLVSLGGEDPYFYTEFLFYGKTSEFRLHDVPAGTYRIAASFVPFVYKGLLEVPKTQPFVVEITLETEMVEIRPGRWSKRPSS